MSLIFQSLQKTRRQSPVQDAGERPGVPVAAAPAPALRVWMRPVLLVLVLVLALGCGAVYGLQFLKDRLPPEAVHNNIHPVPAPDAAMIRRAVHESPVATSPSMLSETAADGVRTRFYPPETRELQETAAAAVPPIAVAAPVRDASPPRAGPPASEPLPAPAAGTAEPGRAGDESSVPDTGAAEFEARREAARKTHQQALEKRMRIGRLVDQIEDAIAGGAAPGRTADLLERLARLKGRDHPYVAKLRAYWHLKQKRYAQAEADLQKVIAARPDDLEAGINLALIEIHNRQYARALERLKRLRQMHPENTAVADLIKRLR